MAKVWKIGFLLLAFILTGCINYEEEITLKSDGSGTMIIHYSVGESLMKLVEEGEQDQNPDELLDLLKSITSGEAIKESYEAEGVTVRKVESYRQTGRYHVRIVIDFKDVNELPDKWLLGNRGVSFREEGNTLVYRSSLSVEEDTKGEINEGEINLGEDEELQEMIDMVMEGWTLRYTLNLPPYSKVVYANLDARVEDNTITWEFPITYSGFEEKLEMVAVISSVAGVEPQKKLITTWGRMKVQ